MQKDHRVASAHGTHLVAYFMIKKALNWLGGILAQHTVLQLVTAVPLAYLIGWGVEIRRGAKAVFDAPPPLFWLILAATALAVMFYPAFVAPIVRWRKSRREAYREDLEGAYAKVSVVYKPEVLDPKHPGNPHAMREYAQNAVDALRPMLIRKYAESEVPPMIDVGDEASVRQWYEYLRQERAASDG